jgi:hypothetical protein
MRTIFKVYLCVLFIIMSISKSFTISIVERPAITPVILGKNNMKFVKGLMLSKYNESHIWVIVDTGDMLYQIQMVCRGW